MTLNPIGVTSIDKFVNDTCRLCQEKKPKGYIVEETSKKFFFCCEECFAKKYPSGVMSVGVEENK